MKASDFNLKDELKFDFEQGITSFRDSRLVLLDADALGLLRQNLIEVLGIEQARHFFLRFGYQHGFSDFMQCQLSYEFENDTELFAAGPVLHTWEGLVKASLIEINFDRTKGSAYLKGLWKNSYEAEQHLSYNTPWIDPVCWSLMGYASGWSTGFFGVPMLAIEEECIGRGDKQCCVVIQPASCWSDAVALPYREAFKDFHTS